MNTPGLDGMDLAVATPPRMAELCLVALAAALRTDDGQAGSSPKVRFADDPEITRYGSSNRNAE